MWVFSTLHAKCSKKLNASGPVIGPCANNHATLEAKSNINPNASVGAPNPGTNGTHAKILDFDSKGAYFSEECFLHWKISPT